jgi:ketosteroid isomerase-like protein
VKLLLDEIVEHPDADHVLRTLEPFLREVSLETVRTEDQLIVYGLGPSFRTMNPKDTTIVRATSQASATALHTEANFLASALAGNAAQDEIVRSKIERAFESLKTELSYGAPSRPIAATNVPMAAPPVPQSPVVEAEPAIAEVTAPVVVEVEKTLPVAMEQAPEAVQAAAIETTPAPEAEPVPEAKAEPEAKPEVKAEPKIEAKLESKPAPQPEPKPISQPEPKLVAKREEPVLTASRQSAPEATVEAVDEEPVRKKRSALLWVLPLLLLLLLAAAFYLLHHRGDVQGLFGGNAEGHAASISVEHPAATPAPVPTTASVATPAPAAMPTDVKEWVQAWAAAMRTRDAQAQLAFYATPLDRYFLTPNVSKEQLLKDKQAEIDDRKGVWTFKAEDVVVKSQTATSAVVYLVKHIIVELPSSTMREQRLKAQLKLKMVDGEWKIISERTIA